MAEARPRQHLQQEVRGTAPDCWQSFAPIGDSQRLLAAESAPASEVAVAQLAAAAGIVDCYVEIPGCLRPKPPHLQLQHLLGLLLLHLLGRHQGPGHLAQLVQQLRRG